ncbi:MAG: PfkB family carbohydrate kinase [Pseudomonadota bacterium]
MSRGSTRAILCIGAAHWDLVARAHAALPPGADVPGHVETRPGGVALNIAIALASRAVRPLLLSVIGEDASGRALIATAEARGVDCTHVTRTHHPTGRYVALEGPEGALHAAVADVALLEATGGDILAPLATGRIPKPFRGLALIDGNLAPSAIAEILATGYLAEADIRLAPASPEKAYRLLPLLAAGGAIYANLAEAEVLAGTPLPHADAAAEALLALGARAALVTDGPRPAAWATPARTIRALPPPVRQKSVTGAGDILAAAHIAAETTAQTDWDALRRALRVAAWHVAGSPAGGGLP